MKLTNPIPVTPTRNLKVSSWSFDKPALYAGETGYIVEVLAADPVNPFYLIRRPCGETFPCHRHQLVQCGALS